MHCKAAVTSFTRTTFPNNFLKSSSIIRKASSLLKPKNVELSISINCPLLNRSNSFKLFAYSRAIVDVPEPCPDIKNEFKFLCIDAIDLSFLSLSTFIEVSNLLNTIFTSSSPTRLLTSSIYLSILPSRLLPPLFLPSRFTNADWISSLRNVFNAEKSFSFSSSEWYRLLSSIFVSLKRFLINLCWK